MKRYILLIIVGLFSMASFAHNPDASTIVLVEKENNIWVLQVSASLTAFQQEIRTHFAETPYKTPEEFQQMVLEHVKNNLHISFNDGENITLGKGIVKLGHETNVVFEVLDVPSEIHSVSVENTAFKEIYRNQSALIIFREGFSKEHFVLNDANNHTLRLYVYGNTFKITDSNKSNKLSSYIGWVLGGIFLLFMAMMAISNMFKPEKFELRPIR